MEINEYEKKIGRNRAPTWKKGQGARPDSLAAPHDPFSTQELDSVPFSSQTLRLTLKPFDIYPLLSI